MNTTFASKYSPTAVVYSTSAILDEVLCVIKTVARKFVTINVIRAGMDVEGTKNVAHVNTTRKLLGT